MVVKPKHVETNFNVNFNVLLSKYIVHQLMKIKTLIIHMMLWNLLHSQTVECKI
jgi:hypothetical protein